MAKIVNICDVCTEIFAGGDAPKGRISKERTEDYPIPIYSNGEEKSGLYGFTDTARVEKPSVTVSARGTIGYTAIRAEPFVPIVRLITLVPDQDKIDIKYLYYAVQNYAFEGSGTSIPQLTVPMLKKYNFPLPPKEEQNSVVSALEKVSELISQRKEQLAKLDQLVKSRFIELMDSTELSEEVTVEQITERVKVGFVGTCEKYYTDASGIPMLRTGNITDHGIDMSDLKYVTLEFHDKNRKSQIRSGDLLIARHGSNGQANVYDGPEAQCLNAVVIVPNQNIAISTFLAGLINSPAVKEQIDRTLVGSTQHVVNTKSIANLVVRIPCLEVQEQYEAFVEQTDKSKLAIQQSLEKLETLKKSLMQQYFG